MKRITLVNFLLCTALGWLPGTSAHAAAKTPVSATIQATARVVPSQGISSASVEVPTPCDHGTTDLCLWLTESNALQVQVEADGQPVDFRLTSDNVDGRELSVLDRHRRPGQVQRRLQLDPIAGGADSCTITLVNPTN